MDLETISMTIISYAGDARTKAFEALREARSKNFDRAEKLLEEANESSAKAHKTQTDLLFKEANGEEVAMNVLLVHAQDHLMTSMLALELIEEILYLHKEKKDK